MTQEEKAKTYDEVVNKLRRFMEQGVDPLISRADVQDFFPELAEPEDEKIRKHIYNYINVTLDDNESEEKERWLAWLERQGNKDKLIKELGKYKVKYTQEVLSQYLRSEDDKKYIEKTISFLEDFAYKGYEDAVECIDWLKSFNLEKQEAHQSQQMIPVEAKEATYTTEVETGDGGIKVLVTGKVVMPKFKVGDWVVCEVTGSVYQIKNCIENLSNHKYGYDLTNGGYIGSDEVNHYHIWTIKDAKAGDVLASKDGNNILIFRNLDDNTSFSSYYNIAGKGELGWSNKCFIPATKEQRDLLFAKMKEAGYEWNGEKKELRKIEQKTIKSCAEYFNKNNELKMTELSEFQNKLADILMEREYTGSTETEEDMAKGRLEYELAAIKISEEILPLAQKRY